MRYETSLPFPRDGTMNGIKPDGTPLRLCIEEQFLDDSRFLGKWFLDAKAGDIIEVAYSGKNSVHNVPGYPPGTVIPPYDLYWKIIEKAESGTPEPKYCGKNVKDMTGEELVEAIQDMLKELHLKRME